jgi:hypothetical protein
MVLIAAAGERASMRFLEFFAANIRNLHTRRAYARAAAEFLTWCGSAGVLFLRPDRRVARDDGRGCLHAEVSLDEVERIVI